MTTIATSDGTRVELTICIRQEAILPIDNAECDKLLNKPLPLDEEATKPMREYIIYHGRGFLTSWWDSSASSTFAVLTLFSRLLLYNSSTAFRYIFRHLPLPASK